MKQAQPKDPEIVQPDDDEVVDLDPTVIGGPLERIKAVPDAFAHFEKMQAILPKLRAASIQLTRPQDWVQMGPSVYFQGIGAERITHYWGILLGEPLVEREQFSDGTYAYVVTGPCGSRLTGVVFQGVQGGRWSGEEFFERFNAPRPARAEWEKMTPEERSIWKQEHRLEPNPLAVRKAAVTNWQVRCITMLTGLRGLTPDDLKAHGITAGRTVSYAAGKHGGKATETNAEGKKVFPEAFKDLAGKTVADVDDARLSKLMDYFQKAVADPAKSKYRAENEAWVDEIEREIERRSRKEA